MGSLSQSKYVRDRLAYDLASNPHPGATQIHVLQGFRPQDGRRRGPAAGPPTASPEEGQMELRRHVQDHVQPGHPFQREMHEDSLDGQFYAMSQIDWIIKKVRERARERESERGNVRVYKKLTRTI